MRLFILFVCLLQTCWATPPSPILYDSHLKITAWNDRKICEPEFVYQIDPNGIKIILDTALIETRADSVSLFRILKAQMSEIRKINKQHRKCIALHAEGVSITFKGEVFSIAIEDFQCKEMNPKLRLDLQRLYSSIIQLDDEMENQRESSTTLRALSKCYPL